MNEMAARIPWGWRAGYVRYTIDKWEER
jgi:hypothetical protein